MEQKLKREQRKLSRRALNAKNNGIKLSDARNYQKQKQIVARLQEKVFNQRNDYLNKLSTNIIKNHDNVCIEDLNVNGMRSEEHTSELQSRGHLVCRLLLEKKKHMLGMT